jgi:hypothetical protein
MQALLNRERCAALLDALVALGRAVDRASHAVPHTPADVALQLATVGRDLYDLDLNDESALQRVTEEVDHVREIVEADCASHSIPPA